MARDTHDDSLDSNASSLLADLGHGNRPGKRPAARGTAFYPRKRANTACQVCRARKTKCDNKKPSCSYCLSVGANCIQSPVDLSSFDPASLKILDRLDDLERLLRSREPEEEEVRTRIAEDIQPLPVIGNDRSPGAINGYHRDYEAQEEVPLRSVLPERVESILQWSVFSDGQLPRDLPSAASPTSSVASVINSRGGSLAELAEMDQQGINQLLDKFFIGIHSKNPILDEPSARRLVRRAFLEGIDWSPASCLALIICALGCLATPFGPSHDIGPGSPAYTDSQIFFQAAQKRIGILLTQSDIIGAQCLFLSGVYMMSVFQPIVAWRFFSQALAACQHFPFLRRAQNMSTVLPDFSSDSMEMGRRDTQEQAVYWSAWKSERELRVELSLPDFGTRYSGNTLYPPFFPAPPQPAVESPGVPHPQDQRARAAWLFYLAEISLRRLNSRLCSEIMNLRQDNPPVPRFLDVLAEMIPEYEMQSREWAAKLPAPLSIQVGDDEDICRWVLRGHLADLFEIMYWPFIVVGLDALASGRHMSATVHTMFQRSLENHVSRLQDNEPGFLHRHHGALFTIKSCTRSALVLVAAANLSPAMPPGWSEMVYKVVALLNYWSAEVPDLGHWKSILEREISKAIG